MFPPSPVSWVTHQFHWKYPHWDGEEQVGATTVLDTILGNATS